MKTRSRAPPYSRGELSLEVNDGVNAELGIAQLPFDQVVKNSTTNYRE
jgi:hypothetical protein